MGDKEEAARDEMGWPQLSPDFGEGPNNGADMYSFGFDDGADDDDDGAVFRNEYEHAGDGDGIGGFQSQSQGTQGSGAYDALVAIYSQAVSEAAAAADMQSSLSKKVRPSTPTFECFLSEFNVLLWACFDPVNGRLYMVCVTYELQLTQGSGAYDALVVILSQAVSEAAAAADMQNSLSKKVRCAPKPVHLFSKSN